MRSRLLAFGTAACIVAVASTAGAKEVSYHRLETFSVQQGAVLELHHEDGNVTVEKWKRNDVEIEVTYLADVRQIGLGTTPEYQVKFEQKGDRVIVKGGTGGHTIMIGTYTETVRKHEYKVRAPSWVELDFQGEDGDVEVSNWNAPIAVFLEDGDLYLENIRGDLSLRLEDGECKVRDIEGDIEARTEDGDLYALDCEADRAKLISEDGSLHLSGCSGTWRLETEDGDVDVREHRGGALEVSTDDGDVDVALLGSNQDVRVSTADGDAVVRLDRNADVAFELESDDGTIDVRLPHAEVSERGHHLVIGEAGSGAGIVRVRTNDGAVVLRSS